jgi:hypothetical protein
MTLEVVRDDPCKDHPCDSCATCRRGRCCRNDNPNYKLPELGDWDELIYGELGALNTDGKRLECHACGEWYVGLGTHAWRAHGITADEYRAYFGLAQSTGLEPAWRLAQRATLMRGLMDTGRIPPGLIKQYRPTPEQQSAMSKGRKLRLQSTKGGRWTEIRKGIAGRPEVRRKISDAAKARPMEKHLANLGAAYRPDAKVEVVCQRCGKRFMRKPSAATGPRFCSRECHDLQYRDATCKNGHLWTPETTRYLSSGRWVCVLCRKEVAQRYRARLRSQAGEP